MAFGNGQFMKIWEVADKGSYAEVSMSSSKKNKQTGEYETDFSSKYVRFVGNAKLQKPMKGQRIKITECSVQNVYYKNGERQFLKNPAYVVFSYELQQDGAQPNTYVPSAYLGGSSGGFEQMDLDEGGLPF
jgi:hypothetical protein